MFLLLLELYITRAENPSIYAKILSFLFYFYQSLMIINYLLFIYFLLQEPNGQTKEKRKGKKKNSKESEDVTVTNCDRNASRSPPGWYRFLVMLELVVPCRCHHQLLWKSEERRLPSILQTDFFCNDINYWFVFMIWTLSTSLMLVMVAVIPKNFEVLHILQGWLKVLFT